MQRMGMVIGVKPDMIAEYRRLHAAVWPEILALISDCNIRNYTIFLREPENLLFGYWNITAPISAPIWRRWRQAQRTRNGGLSPFPASNHSKAARKASGGQ